MSTIPSDLDDPTLNSIYQQVKLMVVGKKFTITQFTVLIPLVMQKLAPLRISGLMKKEMTIKIFTLLVNEMPFSNPRDKTFVQHFVDTDLNTLIDTAYLASLGKFTSFAKPSTSTIFDNTQFDAIKNKIQSMIVSNDVNATGVEQPLQIYNLILLVPTIMKEFSQFTNLTGLQKKDLVVQVIVEILSVIRTGNPLIDLLLQFSQQMLPTVVDILYRAATNEYVIQHVEKGCKSIFSCSCCKKKN